MLTHAWPFLHLSRARSVKTCCNSLTVFFSTASLGRKLYTRTNPKRECLVVSKKLPLHRSSNCLSCRFSGACVCRVEYLTGPKTTRGKSSIIQGCAIPNVHLCRSPNIAMSRRKGNGAKLYCRKESFCVHLLVNTACFAYL